MNHPRVERAVAELKAGRMVILVDDEGRENEGDLCLAAGHVTPAAINFMATHGRGLICLAMSGARLDDLNVPMMVADNSSPFGTGFTVSVEAATGVTTGISAYDRARTIAVAANPAAGPADLVRPGHVFPLRARDGGVLVRTGQTEGSVDLARLAGLAPAAVICEIMADDGHMARGAALDGFAAHHRLAVVSVAELVDLRWQREAPLEAVGQTSLPGLQGAWHLRHFVNRVDHLPHVALVDGTPLQAPAQVRVVALPDSGPPDAWAARQAAAAQAEVAPPSTLWLGLQPPADRSRGGARSQPQLALSMLCQLGVTQVGELVGEAEQVHEMLRLAPSSGPRIDRHRILPTADTSA